MGILLLAGLVLGWSGSVVAAKGRVGVRILGTQEGAARDAVVQLLKQHNFTVVDAGQLEKTAAQLHLGLDTQADLKALASKLKLVGVVAGEVTNGTRAGIVVRNGQSGWITAKGTWSASDARALADTIKANAWARLGPALSGGGDGSRRVAGRGRRNSAEDAAAEAAVAMAAAELDDDEEAAPPREKPAPAPKLSGKSDADLEREAGIAAGPAKPPAAEPPPKGRSDADLEREAGLTSDSKRKGDRSARGRKSGDDDDAVVARPGARRGDGGRGLTALELAVGPRLLWRSLNFGGAPSNALVPFSMNGTPTFGANLAWYPGAHTGTGVGANFGVAASVEYASAINSKASDGATFPTATSDMFGGVRARLPIRSAALTATGGYGRHAFVFHSGTTTDRANINVPDTDNKYLRIAGDLFVPLAAGVSLSLGAGYRNVLGPGKSQYQIASEAYFPDATVSGIDATVGVGYRFLSVMEARVGYDLRRYTYKTHGGASAAPLPSFVDSYSALYLSLGLSIDGPPRQTRKAAKSDEDDDEG